LNGFLLPKQFLQKLLGANEFDITCSGSNVLDFGITDAGAITEIEFYIKSEKDKIWAITDLKIENVDPLYIDYSENLNPFGIKTVDIEEDTYEVRIYENDILMETVEDYIIPDETTLIYDKLYTTIINLGFYDNDYNTLDFNIFKTYIEKYEGGITRSGYIHNPFFYADEDSKFNITIYDLMFDTLIYSADNVDVSPEVNINLEAEDCLIFIEDSGGKGLNFVDFNVYVDSVFLSDNHFVGIIDDTVTIDINNLYGIQVASDDHIITSGTNLITVTLPYFDVQNNADEIINVTLVDQEVYTIYSGGSVDWDIFIIDYTINITELVFPYSNKLVEYNASLNYTVVYCDFYSNILEVLNLTVSDSNELVFNPSNVRTCFISLSDQRNNYLPWENYKTKLNGTLLYEPYFYKELETNWNISIYDRYDIYLASTVHVVTRDDNFISITIDLFSLKIFNQQEVFNWVNLTRDPNYDQSDEYWSEWISPGEIIHFRIPSGYWKLNVTSNEFDSSAVYDYTLNGDDILLITSDNTIANSISNIQNVNTTIGNQITNVEINITNQNSEINNTIVNIDINLTNVNSTIGNLLLAQNTTITAIGNNITNLYAYTGTQFEIIGNNINSSFVDLNSSVYLINNSIYTAVQSVSATLSNLNNTINGNLTILVSQNDYLTQIYQFTMFSDLLNWSETGNNASYIEDQIDSFDFINNYRNESVQLLLRYQDEIDTLLVSSQETINQLLPSDNVDWRIKSIETGEYLNEWQNLDNTSVTFGFYEDVFNPSPIDYQMDIILGIVFALVIGIGLAVLYYRYKRELQKSGGSRKPKKNNMKFNSKAIRDERY